MNAVAFDTETFYSSDYSITIQGSYNYTHDPRFDCYLASFYAPDFQWVGNPKDLDWTLLERYDTFVSHNAQFDKNIHKRLVELGIAKYSPKNWVCTANMAAYTCGLRSLKNAAKNLLGQEVDKEIRDELKGLHWNDICANDLKAQELQAKIETTKSIKVAGTLQKRLQSLPTREKVLSYALSDAKRCYEIFEKYHNKWPEIERRVSEFTIKQCSRGIQIDTGLLNIYKKKLIKYREIAENRLPWVKEGMLPLSSKAIEAECLKEGIEKPKSMAQTSEEAEKWISSNSKFRWVKAIRSFRKLNIFITKLERFEAKTNPEGRLSYDLLYFGASGTGRFSGAGSLNLQNLPRKGSYGIDLRRILIPKVGHKFIVADFSAIEPKSALALVKDITTLDLIRSGMNLYESHARASMGWTGGELKKEDPQKYSLAKARILSLTYGASWKKFVQMVTTYGLDADIIFGGSYTKEEEDKFLEYQGYVEKDFLETWKSMQERIRRRSVNAFKEVMSFRESNPKITECWKKLGNMLKASVGRDLAVKLPSGRSLVYRNVEKEKNNITAVVGDKRMKVYSSLIFENCVQAVARDIFVTNMLKVEDAGFPVVLQLHDEIVVEVEKPIDIKTIVDIFSSQIEWLPLLPLTVEAVETDHYLK